MTILNQMVKLSTLDQKFGAIADPTRRQILERLSQGPATMSELAAPLPISLPGLMKHVRLLESVGLVETEKHGRARSCRLGNARLDDAEAWLERHRQRWERRLDRIDEYVGSRRRGSR